MPVTKQVLMKAFCDECKATIERVADKGSVQDMIDFARDAGWRIGSGGYKALCPKCIERHKDPHPWMRPIVGK